jgi:hypothetical protein
MSLASTSRVQVRYIKESVFGVTPTSGNSRELRITGESLNFNLTKEASTEINAFRGVSSMVPTSAEASGSVNAEMQFGEYDEFFSGVIQSPWVAFGTAGVGASFSATITATTITASTATAGTSLFTLLRRGQWFSLEGANPANSKLFRVSKLTSPTSTVITLDAGTPGVVGGPFASASIRASRLTNGVTQPSYTLERASGDTGEFFAYRGMTPGSMSLSISSGALSTMEFMFMGKDAVANNATHLPGTPTASLTYPIMSGVSGSTCALWASGSPMTGTFVNSISLSYDNTLRAQAAVCSLGSVAIGSGTIQVTADLEVYFASGRQFFSEFLTNEAIEISFTAFDSLGNGYIFTLPKANISSYNLNAGSADSDLMASISVTGLLDMGNADPLLRRVIMIDRVGAALVP